MRHEVRQITSSMVLARFEQNSSPNVECFVQVIQINHDSTIDMLACHINQLVGTTSGFGKFTASVLIRTKLPTEIIRRHGVTKMTLDIIWSFLLICEASSK